MTVSVFLLGAGYGERLKPLTDRIPKPAITFQGKSALEINSYAIQSLEPIKCVVNTHHLPEEVAALAQKLGCEVVHEPAILGTGGCIPNAAPKLWEADTFLIQNSDILHTIDLAELLKRHLASGALATLAGVNRSEINTLSCNKDGKLLGVHNYEPFDNNSEAARLTFAGIAFYQRQFLRYVRHGACDIKQHWSQTMKGGGSLQVADCSEDNWYDFGSPQGLWDAARFFMEATGEYSYNYLSASDGEEPPCVSNEVGQDDLPEGLRNVLVFEETFRPIPKGTQNCIIGRDFKWDIQA